jgi:putative N6-adenine-specific DNA methylase
MRVGEFSAVRFAELRRKASNLPWENYLSPGQPVAFRVTCHKSRLYHSGAVEQRVAGAIADRLGKPFIVQLFDERAGGSLPQLIIVRLVRDECTISLDTSGEALHRRGYRQATAKAPLRETLAAAMLLASSWEVTAPLLDPFCGSGTIPIEAALLALNLPPGRNRRFAFMDWPNYDRRAWEKLLAEIRLRTAEGLAPISGSDRDAGAIQMGRENAERAGVAEYLEFSQRAVSAIQPPTGPGWVVTNPPYGVRVSPGKDLRNLYAQFGNVLREKCPGWRLAMLSTDDRLISSTGIRFHQHISTVNGGVNVKLVIGEVGDAQP